VQRFLGEGGKKRVYLAHDTRLDRDVAIGLIKTEGLDEAGRERIARESRAMGRLGDHPHIVTVYDVGEEDGTLYLVSQYMAGGSVEDLLRKSVESRQRGVERDPAPLAGEGKDGGRPRVAPHLNPPPQGGEEGGRRSETCAPLAIDHALRIADQVCQALEHAHGRGVIHRDLKPGNIWLTRDGTAKLGDFGLALALDRSRMTQEGMMLGTVAYMPPEQALGGEVTERSDLYALGAVLYEMVTGRPPFVGDDAVAIVSQHLNTAPVDPTWHSPAVPPSLNALILQLLEKDPTKRPASAVEVRSVLASIDLSAHSSLGTQHPALGTPSPVYRRTFVGRETELRQLEGAFDAALSGHGALVMVVGEPGIGKTSLCEQLATYVAMRGGIALVGHCYEEGSLSLPYLPFVEAMRSYVMSRESDTLRAELGSGAGEVARIVSEVRERVTVEPAPAGDAEESRYHLLQAVTGFLRNASAVQPLLVILEDLHDADRGTLDMLSHVARDISNVAGARLLLVGTYRDVEVDRAHPLSGALAELRRLHGFARVALRGLTPDEVRRMLAAIANQDVPWSLAESVHRSTEGNPLFVQEVMRHLAEEGVLTRKGGGSRSLSDSQLAASIPEGLRDVIGRRLSRLSTECNRVLQIAAVIGREFPLKTLCAVGGISEDAVINALEEAMRVAVLTEQARGGVVSYRFAHAFFRQTLYEESIAPRRIRIHQQVARALEAQYAGRLEEHAAELAEHFAHSSDPADLAKAVHYGEMAASRAMTVFAYGEAVRLLEQALQVQEVVDPNDKAKRCDLLLALAAVLLPAGEPQRAVDTIAPEAFELAEALGDRDRASKACTVTLATFGAMTAGAAFLGVEAQQWTERADRYAAPRSVARVRVDISRSLTLFWAGAFSDARAFVSRAVALAQEVGDPETLWFTTFLSMAWHSAPGDFEHLLAQAQETAMRSRRGAPAAFLAFSLDMSHEVFTAWGRRAEAERLAKQVEGLALKARDPGSELLVQKTNAMFAMLDGNLERGLEIATQVRAGAIEVGRAFWGFVYTGPIIDTANFWLGHPVADLDARIQSADVDQQFGAFAAFALARDLARAGLMDAARRWLRNVFDRGAVGPDTPSLALLHVLEAAVLVADREAAARLSEWLAPTAPLSKVPIGLACPARQLGAAAALLGNPEQARSYYQQALETAGKIRFRPEIALTHLQLAELLLEHYPAEQKEALGHLDSAAGEFRAMNMKPWLERAMRYKMKLQGIDSTDFQTSIDAVSSSVQRRRPDLRSHSAPDGTVTLMFSDMEGFTAMTERLGDLEARKVIANHNRIVREQVQKHGGFEVELQGDGFLLAFPSARRGVLCAIAIQQQMAAYSKTHPEQPIKVRIGLHTGEAIREADKFFGKTVILAARIAAQAQGGEILVSSMVKELTQSAGDVHFGESHVAELKGLTGKHTLHEVRWS
jgi:serine/threonine protein kinase/class 3 adenylate cyclase